MHTVMANLDGGGERGSRIELAKNWRHPVLDTFTPRKSDPIGLHINTIWIS